MTSRFYGRFASVCVCVGLKETKRKQQHSTAAAERARRLEGRKHRRTEGT